MPKEEQWEKDEGRSNTIWNTKENPAKEGEALIGEIVERRDGKYGLQCVIKTADGEEYLTPSHAWLQSRLEDEKKYAKGNLVKIVYLGVRDYKGRDTQTYDVYVKK